MKLSSTCNNKNYASQHLPCGKANIAIKSQFFSHQFHHSKPVRLERRVTAGAEAGAGGTSKKATASRVELNRKSSVGVEKLGGSSQLVNFNFQTS